MAGFRGWAWAFAVWGLFPVAGIGAAADGSASGWLEVKGQRVALKFAFAAMSEDLIEGIGKEKIAVLLSDRPVPAELRKATDAWSSWAGDQAEKGELSGVILYINSATKAWSRGQKLSRRGMEFYSQSVSSPELRDLVFAPAASGAGEIAGKVFMKKPMTGVDEDGGPWRVEAEFRTPLIPRAAITASYTGAEALKSAPYKAVQAYLESCRKKDLDAIRRMMTKDAQQMLARFEQAQGKQAALEMVTGMAGETLKLKLASVTVRGDTAEVAFTGGPKEETSREVMQLALEGGAWKIGQ